MCDQGTRLVSQLTNYTLAPIAEERVSEARESPDMASDLEPVSGIEPLTCRLQGAFEPSRDVADRGLMRHLAGLIVGWVRLTSPGICLRWLPIWLPDPGAPSFVRLQICSPAASRPPQCERAAGR